MATLPSSSPPHFVIFPFMAKGHTIPLVHLTRLLLRRNITVTIFTTPMNSPFICKSLHDTNVSVISLPFPVNVPGLPAGVESTDKLPSMSLHVPFAQATKLMQPDFEKALHTLPNVSCVISDGFLVWAQHTAEKLGIPRLIFYGTNNYTTCLYRILCETKPHACVDSYDESFSMPSFPWIEITKNDIDKPFDSPDPKGPVVDYVVEQFAVARGSKGYISNSFYELEPTFVDFWNKECAPKTWCVGPLSLAEPPNKKSLQKPMWIQWLDEKLENGKSVLYVAFGTQAEISEEQLEEIALGLERAEVNFLWLVRSRGSTRLDRIKEKVKERGLIVSDWVDQVEILNHECVNGFMSHCGWNSVLESICASVPILAWPMMAEQHLNARMVVEELGVGVRVLSRNGSVRGFVGSECIADRAKELMEGEKGKEVRKKVKEMGRWARKAMEEGGSSSSTLDHLINEVCGNK